MAGEAVRGGAGDGMQGATDGGTQEGCSPQIACAAAEVEARAAAARSADSHRRTHHERVPQQHPRGLHQRMRGPPRLDVAGRLRSGVQAGGRCGAGWTSCIARKHRRRQARAAAPPPGISLSLSECATSAHAFPSAHLPPRKRARVLLGGVEEGGVHVNAVQLLLRLLAPAAAAPQARLPHKLAVHGGAAEAGGVGRGDAPRRVLQPLVPQLVVRDVAAHQEQQRDFGHACIMASRR